MASDRVLAAVLASSRLPTKVAFATRAVLNGLWLGVLSDDDLRALDERYHTGKGPYRTDEWNERGLFPWEQELVDAHLPPGGRVAVLGAGGGREVLALRAAGFDAIGFEPHGELAAFGERFLASRGHTDALRPSRRDRFPDGTGPLDAVLVGWGALSLIHGRSRRIGLLADARRHLPPGGAVVLSFFERDGDPRELRITRTLAGGLRRLRGADPVELGDTLSPNRAHCFSVEELREEAGAAGFDVAEHRVLQPIEGALSYGAAVLRARG